MTLFAGHSDFAASDPATLETPDAGRVRTAPDLRLRAGAKVSGVVLDAGGVPVAGAEVSGVGDRDPDFEPVFDDNPTWTGEKPEEFEVEPPHVTAGTDGRFTLDRVTPGFWVFRATARGHGPAFSQPIELREGAAREGVTLRLPAGADLTGYVMAPGGRPIPRARVHARLTGEEVGDARSTSSGADGRFSIPGLLAKEYGVSVAAEGYADWEGTLGAGRGDQTITLHHHAALLVRVRDERAEGSPALKGFAVEAVAAGAEGGAPGRVVDTRGGGLAEPSPGVYRLDLAPEAAAVLAASRLRVWVLLRDGRLAASAPTPSAPGGETEVAVVVPAGVVVRGTVKDSEGSPVAGARVSLAGPDAWDEELGGTPLEWAALSWEGIRAERDGTFIVRLTGEGPWVLKAAAEGYESGTGGEIRSGSGAPAAMDVEIVLKVPPAQWVRGVLRDSAGSPVSDVTVWLMVPGNVRGRRVLPAKTDTDGRFAFAQAIPAGRYGAQLQRGAGELIRIPELEIREGASTDLSLTWPGVLRVTGVSGVVLRNGLPWKGAGVAILGGDATVAGPDGAFRLGLDDRGGEEAVLLVSARPGGPYLHSEVLSAGRPERPLRIELRPAMLRGRVECEDPAVIHGASVELTAEVARGRRRGEGGDLVPDRSTFRDSAALGDDGSFVFGTLPGLETGCARFRLSADGVELLLPDVSLMEGEERMDVVWRVKPVARVHGRVLDAFGNPVSGAIVRPQGGRIAKGSVERTDVHGCFDLQLWAKPESLTASAPGVVAPGSYWLEWPDSGVIERDFRLP
ncbi:MAG: carboxypeptidase-like regulatory domain-containing protein [Planctomycetales bacterium]|nr:carboxypeptidase-like regulatory domain-containing protein [Planctomycetales bacterium]